jgi:hypothetical protein
LLTIYETVKDTVVDHVKNETIRNIDRIKIIKNNDTLTYYNVMSTYYLNSKDEEALKVAIGYNLELLLTTIYHVYRALFPTKNENNKIKENFERNIINAIERTEEQYIIQLSHLLAKDPVVKQKLEDEIKTFNNEPNKKYEILSDKKQSSDKADYWVSSLKNINIGDTPVFSEYLTMDFSDKDESYAKEKISEITNKLRNSVRRTSYGKRKKNRRKSRRKSRRSLAKRTTTSR